MLSSIVVPISLREVTEEETVGGDLFMGFNKAIGVHGKGRLLPRCWVRAANRTTLRSYSCYFKY